MEVLAPSAMARDALTVSELVGILRSAVTRHPALADVLVRGEVGNVSRPPSGVAYFTLRDADAQLACVLFRAAAAALRFELRDGVEVLARGDVDVFPAKGQVQLVVRDLSPVGHGAFWLSFEQVRDRLAAEGLFEAVRKRPLPRFPHRIGLVTSEAGAAMHDVLAVLGRRYPLAEILVSPCLVQGEEAPASIAAAFERLSGRVDVAILARGGGSLEDLWAFNDERVARAIVGFPAPVISAVGHETDVTISDFAADVRAPTPSAAAGVVAPDVAGLRDRVAGARTALDLRIHESMESWREAVASVADRLRPEVLRERMRAARKRLGATSASLVREGRRAVEDAQTRRAAIASQLEAVSPLATIARGFAVVTRKDGALVASVAAAVPGDEITVHVSDGSLEAVVEERRRKEA